LLTINNLCSICLKLAGRFFRGQNKWLAEKMRGCTPGQGDAFLGMKGTDGTVIRDAVCFFGGTRRPVNRLDQPGIIEF
jgi:hypothetical protein